MSKPLHRRDEFLEQLDTWSTFAMANLFWVLLSIPLITSPLATVGLFQVMSKWVRGKSPEFFQDFFDAIRRYGIKALLIGLVDAVAFGFIGINLSILIQMDLSHPITALSFSFTVFTGVGLMLVNLYIWSLLVVFDEPIAQIIKMSVKLAVAHPLWSLGVLAGAIAPFLMSYVLPPLVLLFFTVSMSAWIVNKGTWQIIRRYLSDAELHKLENIKEDETGVS